MNLDRLKSSGLLIAGLDSFLGSWLQIDHSPLKPVYPEETLHLIERLPEELKSFYTLLHDWPQLGFFENIHDNHLYVPPKFHSFWNGAEFIELKDFVDIVVENQGCWNVVFALEGPHKGYFLQNNELIHGDNYLERWPGKDDPNNWDRIHGRLDEFLVTYILVEIIETFRNYTSPSEQAAANLIFSGVDLDGSGRKFFYDPDQRALSFAYVYGDEAQFGGACFPDAFLSS